MPPPPPPSPPPPSSPAPRAATGNAPSRAPSVRRLPTAPKRTRHLPVADDSEEDDSEAASVHVGALAGALAGPDADADAGAEPEPGRATATATAFNSDLKLALALPLKVRAALRVSEEARERAAGSCDDYRRQLQQLGHAFETVMSDNKRLQTELHQQRAQRQRQRQGAAVVKKTWIQELASVF